MECTYEGLPCLIITHKELNWHPPLGMTSRCRILVTLDREYVVHVIMKEIERGSLLQSPMDTIQYLCTKYSPFSLTHKFCPGIESSKYEKFKEVIRYDSKSIRITREPIFRIDSVSCMLWFKLGKTVSTSKAQLDSVVCSNCIKVTCDLEHRCKRVLAESPSKKLKRHSTSSNAPLKFLSPSSQQKRKATAKMERSNNKRKLKSY
jgi:hypothetical protein